MSELGKSFPRKKIKKSEKQGQNVVNKKPLARKKNLAQTKKLSVERTMNALKKSLKTVPSEKSNH